MIKKRIISMICVLAFIMAFCGCENQEKSVATEPQQPQQAQSDKDIQLLHPQQIQNDNDIQPLQTQSAQNNNNEQPLQAQSAQNDNDEQSLHPQQAQNNNDWQLFQPQDILTGTENESEQPNNIAIPNHQEPISQKNKDNADIDEDYGNFGLSIKFPTNANWIKIFSRQINGNRMEIAYEDLITEADCTLIGVKGGELALPEIDYGKATIEKRESFRSAIDGKTDNTVTFKQSEDKKDVLVTWEYEGYKFAIIGKLRGRNTDARALADTAWYIIENYMQPVYSDNSNTSDNPDPQEKPLKGDVPGHTAPKKSYTILKPTECSDITKIIITDGSTGDRKVIQDSADIGSILDETRQIKVISTKKNDLQGYLYSVALYKNDILIKTISINGSDLIVANGIAYRVNPDTAKNFYNPVTFP